MKKLLLVIDYQNDFVNGALGNTYAQQIYENVKKDIISYQNNNDDIIFTLDTHDDNYLNTIEGKYLPIKHCIKGTFGHELYQDIKFLAKGYPQIEKQTFGSKQLFDLLKNKNYDDILIIGVVTNICVISNAIIVKSIFPNADIKIKKEL